MRERYPDVELHLIGPLQSNKARQAVALFAVIHSLDRPGLCAALARACEKQLRRPKFFVQVNTGEESQRAGVLPDDVDRFVAACRHDYGLEVLGLMCIPPVHAHFKTLANMVRDACNRAPFQRLAGRGGLLGAKAYYR